jgi:transposase
MQLNYTRLTTQQWGIMEKILPVKQKGKYKLLDIVDAILWQLRIGAQWRNLPENFSKWCSVYYFFSQVEKQ